MKEVVAIAVALKPSPSIPTRILFIQRGPDAGWKANRWCLPGGKVEDGESVHGAARRELQEETGFVFGKTDVLHRLGTVKIKAVEGEDFNLTTFMAWTPVPLPVKIEPSFTGFGWFQCNQMSHLPHLDPIARLLHEMTFGKEDRAPRLWVP